MSIGERITELRIQKNLSQGELASALSVSRQAISKWENDQSSPDTIHLIQLADLLDKAGNPPDCPGKRSAKSTGISGSGHRLLYAGAASGCHYILIENTKAQAWIPGLSSQLFQLFWTSGSPLSPFESATKKRHPKRNVSLVGEAGLEPARPQ